MCTDNSDETSTVRVCAGVFCEVEADIIGASEKIDTISATPHTASDVNFTVTF
jgi:hypothetical protein